MITCKLLIINVSINITNLLFCSSFLLYVNYLTKVQYLCGIIFMCSIDRQVINL